MKNKSPDLDGARAKARTVLRELDINQVEDLSDINMLCTFRGVNVLYDRLGNLEGMLIRKKRVIVVRDDIRQIGRTRFTIAHELGHWEMHPGLTQLQACSASDIHGYRGSQEELEANAFAAEFLMPGFVVSKQLEYMAPTLANISALAARFRTTLTATAVRICDFTTLPIFVCFSTNGRISWYRRSKSAEPYRFISYRSELDGNSLARYCTHGPADSPGPEEVEPSAWFPDDFGNDQFQVWEESAILGTYDVTLSIITVEP